MLKYLKIGVSAIALSALFLAPAVTVTLVTADAAYANNGNGKGGGNGNAGNGGNRGNNDGARGNSGNKGGKSKSNNSSKGFGSKSSKSKSGGNGSFGKGLKDFGKSFKRDVNALFGKKPAKSNEKQRTQTKTANSSKPTKGLMHPSNLGKLNGAINSSPRAKEAHIQNGQYASGTGPVSLAAALAVADYEYAMAKEEYDAAVGTAALADAFDTLDGVPQEDVLSAQDLVTEYDTDEDGVLSDDEKQAAVDATEGTDDALSLDDLHDAQSLNDAANLTEGQEMPDEDDVASAREIVEEGEPSTEAVEDAEDNLLAHYKGELEPSTDPEQRLSEDEQRVVDTVRLSNPDEETVSAALETDELETDEYVE